MHFPGLLKNEKSHATVCQHTVLSNANYCCCHYAGNGRDPILSQLMLPDGTLGL